MSKTLNQQAIACEQAADALDQSCVSLQQVPPSKRDSDDLATRLHDQAVALRYAAETLRTLALYHAAKDKLEL